MILTDNDGNENFYSLSYLNLENISTISRDDNDNSVIVYNDEAELELNIDTDSHDVLSRAAQSVEDKQQLKAAIPAKNEELDTNNITSSARPLRVK